MGTLSTLVVRVGSDLQGFETGMAKVHAGIDKGSAKASALGGAFATLGAGLAISIAGAGVAAAKMAADFQSSMTSLVTGAGESESNLGLVSKGILAMAGEVGESTGQLASGLYMIESAGFHGAAGLTILRTAAMGAKVGNADLATVSDALTSALNAYRMPASKAVDVTNDLIATVANGKMHMQDLAGSLGAVLPAASTAGISLAQVSAAIATMTAQGTPAADAATYLRSTILHLENPSQAAAKAMKDVGLNADKLNLALRQRGLSGALEMVTDSISKKFKPGSAEYIAHLSDMVGGTKSIQAALELTGANMATFKANVAAISGAVAHGGGAVAGWSKVQGDFNQSLERGKDALQAGAISIGTKLLPAATQFFNTVLIPAIPKLVSFGERMVDIATAVGGVLKYAQPLTPVILALVGGFMAFKTALMIQALFEGVSTAMTLASGAMALLATGEVSAASAADLLAISELAALAPFILIALAVAAVIAVGYLLITHWKQVSAFAITVGQDIKSGIGAAFNWLGTKVHDFLGWIGTNWPKIVEILGGPVGLVIGILASHWAQITGAVHSVFNALSAWWHTWGKLVVLIMTLPFQLIEVALYAIWARIGGKVMAAFSAIRDFLSGIWNAVHDKAVAFWAAEERGLGIIWDAIKSLAGAVWGEIVSVIWTPLEALGSDIASWWAGVSSVLTNGWNDLLSAAGSIFGQIGSAITGALGKIHIPLPHISISAHSVNLPPPIGKVNVPDPSINWYGMGAIFTKPTVLGGVGVGDAPSGEAVLPLDRIRDYIPTPDNSELTDLSREELFLMREVLSLLRKGNEHLKNIAAGAAGTSGPLAAYQRTG